MKIAATHYGDYILLEYEKVSETTIWEDHGHDIKFRCVHGHGWVCEFQEGDSMECIDGESFVIPGGVYYRFVPPKNEKDKVKNLILHIEHRGD